MPLTQWYCDVLHSKFCTWDRLKLLQRSCLEQEATLQKTWSLSGKKEAVVCVPWQHPVLWQWGHSQDIAGGDLFLPLTQNFLGCAWSTVFNILYKKNLFLLINLRSTKLVRGWHTGERLMELGLSSLEKPRLRGEPVVTFWYWTGYCKGEAKLFSKVDSSTMRVRDHKLEVGTL